MNYSAHWVRFFTTKIKTRFLNRYQFTQKYPSFLQVKVNQTMKRCASTSALPYHIHKVTVSQESIQTKGRMIEFDISVIDTHPDDTDKPTVVGIHGSPGSALDFEPCVQKLAENDVRFIGPTFPGFEGSEVESWKLYHLDYSTAGCASLVLQALDHLEIDRVSMVMAHSAGGWVGCRLAAESHRVKSLCLFNPVGARPHRTLRPQAVIHFMAWLMRFQSLHFLLMPILELAYSLLGFTGVKGGDHLMVSQQTMSCQNFDDTRRHAEEIQKKRLPLLFAYTLNDKIIEQQVYEEMMLQHLGIPRTRVTKVDAERNQTPLWGSAVDSESNSPWYAHGLQFERGGHVVHKAYATIIVDRVLQLLRHVEQ